MQVRDKDSKVLFSKTYASNFVIKRNASKGGHPSAAQDKKMMLKALDETVKRISYRTVWDIRNWDHGKFVKSAADGDPKDGIYKESY